jgi:hypothetical protein
MFCRSHLKPPVDERDCYGRVLTSAVLWGETSRPALLGGLVFGSSLSVRDLKRLGSSASVLGGGFIIESSASVFGDGFIIEGDSSTSAVYLVGSVLSL